MVVAGQIGLLEAALDQIEDGMAILDVSSTVIFWNRAAEAFTGHRRSDLRARPLPVDFYRIDAAHREQAELAQAVAEKAQAFAAGFPGAVAGYTAVVRSGTAPIETEFIERPTLVALRHQQGYTLPAMLRRSPIRDPLGHRCGATLIFHPVEQSDALPHGEAGFGAGVRRSQAEMEDRLDEAHHRWVMNRMPYGLLWITVDQGALLRRTHGREACEAMLGIIEQTLLHALRPTETLGRWGDDDFLVLAHERSHALLIEHAHRLTGLARTADFRWWGDRVTLTVSVGACQATEGATLRGNLQAARDAMQQAAAAGGNGVCDRIAAGTQLPAEAKPADPPAPPNLIVRAY